MRPAISPATRAGAAAEDYFLSATSLSFPFMR
jgi:hypothetical protein